jgi:hypothetical protein
MRATRGEVDMPERENEGSVSGEAASAGEHVDEGTVHAWLDGQLSAAEAARVEAHVAACAACSAVVVEARGYVAASTRILTALDGVPASVAPRARRRVHVWQMRVAAALVVMAAGAVVVLRQPGSARMASVEAKKTTPDGALTADEVAGTPAAPPALARQMPSFAPARTDAPLPPAPAAKGPARAVAPGNRALDHTEREPRARQGGAAGGVAAETRPLMAARDSSTVRPAAPAPPSPENARGQATRSATPVPAPTIVSGLQEKDSGPARDAVADKKTLAGRQITGRVQSQVAANAVSVGNLASVCRGRIVRVATAPDSAPADSADVQLTGATSSAQHALGFALQVAVAGGTAEVGQWRPVGQDSAVVAWSRPIGRVETRVSCAKATGN